MKRGEETQEGSKKQPAQKRALLSRQNICNQTVHIIKSNAGDKYQAKCPGAEDKYRAKCPRAYTPKSGVRNNASRRVTPTRARNRGVKAKKIEMEKNKLRVKLELNIKEIGKRKECMRKLEEYDAQVESSQGEHNITFLAQNITLKELWSLFRLQLAAKTHAMLFLGDSRFDALRAQLHSIHTQILLKKQILVDNQLLLATLNHNISCKQAILEDADQGEEIREKLSNMRCLKNEIEEKVKELKEKNRRLEEKIERVMEIDNNLEREEKSVNDEIREDLFKIDHLSEKLQFYIIIKDLGDRWSERLMRHNDLECRLRVKDCWIDLPSSHEGVLGERVGRVTVEEFMLLRTELMLKWVTRVGVIPNTYNTQKKLMFLCLGVNNHLGAISHILPNIMKAIYTLIPNSHTQIHIQGQLQDLNILDPLTYIHLGKQMDEAALQLLSLKISISPQDPLYTFHIFCDIMNYYSAPEFIALPNHTLRTTEEEISSEINSDSYWWNRIRRDEAVCYLLFNLEESHLTQMEEAGTSRLRHFQQVIHSLKSLTQLSLSKRRLVNLHK